MFNSGDKPGKGDYVCSRCGFVVTLASDDEELPICPRCGNTTFKKRKPKSESAS